MKKLFSLIFLLPMFIYAQEGIKFEKSLTWKQVLQKAKDENKYIFADCYATWCGPCKMMDKTVYSTEKVGKYFNDRFISVKVQMDTSKSDNDFIKSWYVDANMIKNNFKVTAFPTYLFFSPSGDVVHRDVGAFDSDYFICIGSDAVNSEKQYYTVLEKYRRNELDLTSIKTLARKVKRVEGMELAHKIANDFINGLSIDSLFTQDNIQLMTEFTNNSKDRGFVMFKDSAKRIVETNKRMNESACKNIVLSIINNEEIKPYSSIKKGKPDWRIINLNLKKYGPLGEEAFKIYKPGIIFKTEIEHALKINSDWSKILPLVEKQKLGKDAEFVVGSCVVFYLNAIGYYHTEKTCKNLVAAARYYADSFSTFLTANTLNTWSWTIFENSKDNEELRQALEWSKRANELEPAAPDFMDTYANILYKLGLVQEAIIWQKKAIQELRIKKYNNLAVQQNLEKMQKGEKTWP
ncbi:thioredoxin family protein [Niastella sp. OAS944]|uniref:thioredoxin family protein n=1 Tax=Niastella sp. OAS944 TaxID=2664089 RepID=UPI0034717E2E|nr:thioredoxin-related protein [Chitinophagaceae bacterium OAS944]